MSLLGAARVAALGGWAGLLACILIGYGVYAQASWVALLLFAAPLAAAAPGLIRGRPYTYAWTSLLALGYFTLGVWHAAGPQEGWLGAAMLAASLLLFAGTLAYVRLGARARP